MENVLRRPDQTQQRRCNCLSEKQSCEPEQDRQKHRRLDSHRDMLRLLAPDQIGDQDIHPDGQAGGNRNDQRNGFCIRPHCGQGIGIAEMPDNGCICCIK